MTTSGTSRSRLAASAITPAGVGRLERGHDPLRLGEELEAGNRFVVGGGFVTGAARRRERGVLRSDARVIETRTDRVRLQDLTRFVLQVQRTRAVQHTGDA